MLAAINDREGNLARAGDRELRERVWAVLVCWWLLLPWALVLHWRRWREAKDGEPEA
jgi:hypothetical protein